MVINNYNNNEREKCMDVQYLLKNYKRITLRVNIATNCGTINAETSKLIEQKKILDIAIDLLSHEHYVAIDKHYRQGWSYAAIANHLGYAKSTIIKRSQVAVKELTSVLG